jgi:hypothetical protein
LSDPDFEREFFSEKGKISLDKSTPEVPQAFSAPVPAPLPEVFAPSLAPAPTVPAPTTENGKHPQPPELLKESDDTKASGTEPEQDEVVNEGQKDQLEDESLKQQSQEKDKDTPSSAGKTHQSSEYADIKGIVLINGNIIEGQIISMNPYVVKIRTKDGKVASYSFQKDVQRFITE